MPRIVVGAILLLGLTACAVRRTGATLPLVTPSISTLDLLGEWMVPTPAAGDPLTTARFGGISGLVMDPSTRELLGICDDQVNPRVFVFRTVAVPFRVDLKAYFPLAHGPWAPEVIDGEGIAASRSGRLLVSSEGMGTREPRTPPGILQYTRRADYVGQLSVPPKFLPTVTGPIAHGVRSNAAFESLTLTPDERHLLTATETALAQDGDPATTSTGTLARILEYESRGDRFEPHREFAYPIDPLAKPNFTPGFFINGLVELLALSDTEFLSMERGYAEEAGGNGRSMNRIRIFLGSIDGASDVSHLDSLRDRKDVKPVRKRLLLDLSDLKGLSAGLASNLDNFEGMAFGPALADGSRTLIIVSDDNFNAKQQTWFLLFRIGESLVPSPSSRIPHPNP